MANVTIRRPVSEFSACVFVCVSGNVGLKTKRLYGSQVPVLGGLSSPGK